MNIRMSPKDFFLHLGVMLTLYVSSISLVTLLFQVINVAFPDVLDNYAYYYAMYDPYSASIRWAIASIVIVFPIFILLSWLINKDYKAIPEKLTLGIRKTLTYLTLFVAGIAIVTDLIVLLNTFLSGEITTRFILKVVAILAVAGFIFWYYIWDLRRQPGEVTNKPKLFAIIASVLVLACLVWGFIVMGSPGEQRKMRLDAERVSHLESIQWQIVNYWQQKEAIPSNLSDLNDQISGFYIPTDPVTGEFYEYRVITGGENPSFELCANFDLESSKSGRGDKPMPVDIGGGIGNSAVMITPDSMYREGNWQHGVGRTCFARTIDPELYPPVKTQLR